MALFENILGTRPQRMGERPPAARPAQFRPIGRMERADPEIRALYERQRRQWESEVEAEREADKEAEKEYEARMKSQFGSQWRKRVAEQKRAEESAQAQQTLEERSAKNERMQAWREAGGIAPLPEEGKTEVDLPGGGKATFGKETLERIRASRAEQQKEKEAQTKAQKERGQIAKAFGQRLQQQRYEEELASRGLTPPKTREEENVYNRERMAEFRILTGAKDRAARAESAALSDYRSYKQGAQEARKAGNPEAEVEFERRAREMDEMVGGNFQNSTARRRFFERDANEAAKRELEKRARIRSEAMKAQTGANEAATEPPTEPVQTTARPIQPRQPATPAETPRQSAEQARPVEAAPKPAKEEEELNRILGTMDEETRGAFTRAREIRTQIEAEPKTSGRGVPSAERVELRNQLRTEKNKIRSKIRELQNTPEMKVRGTNKRKEEAREKISVLKTELNLLDKLFL